MAVIPEQAPESSLGLYDVNCEALKIVQRDKTVTAMSAEALADAEPAGRLPAAG